MKVYRIEVGNRRVMIEAANMLAALSLLADAWQNQFGEPLPNDADVTRCELAMTERVFRRSDSR